MHVRGHGDARGTQNRLHRVSRGALAFRFDIESLRCLREGVPALRRLARDRGVRFTFFLTMGRAVDIRWAVRRLWCPFAEQANRGRPADRLPIARKLGMWALLETIVFNANLGDKRKEVNLLVADGHELGLHGGANHGTWQHAIHQFDAEQLEAFVRPVLDEFRRCWGPPKGFAAPGFQWNEHVLDMLDREGFAYAGDMTGEHCFRPSNSRGELYRHWQVPVNVIGRNRVGFVEQKLAQGHDAKSVVEAAVAEIRKRAFAQMFEHPYVMGPHVEVLDKIIERIAPDYDVMTVEEYLGEWRRRHE